MNIPRGLTLGEGPRWIASGVDAGLWWVDIIEGLVFQRQSDGSIRRWDLLDQVGMVGALAPAQQGGLVLATQHGWQHFEPSSGQCTLIADPTPGDDMRFNDGAVDPAGRFITGTMPLDMPPGAGQLWALEADGSYRLLRDNLTCPNGIAWSADGNEMYFIDSPEKAIQVFAYDAAKALSVMSYAASTPLSLMRFPMAVPRW